MRNSRAVFPLVLVSVSLAAISAYAGVQEDFETTLELVKRKFHDQYALEPWKTRAFGWTIDGAADAILKEGRRNAKLDAGGARTLIQSFFYSARDYHAKAIYSPGGFTSIPLNVRSLGNHVYVTSVGNEFASAIAPGDELVTIDGVPAMRAVLERTTLRYVNHLATDIRDGERRLTNPYGMLMEKVPTKAEADLVLKGVDGKKFSASLPWSKPAASFAKAERAPAHPMVAENLRGWMKTGFGPRDSYFPKPAKTLWESPSDARFPAWIASLPGSGGAKDGTKKIGWIRIPDFSPGKAADYTAAVKEFETTVAKMNEETDALILDEIANPGGMADYMYALASYFFDREVPTFKFSYRLFPALVKDANDTLPELEKIRSDADAKAFFGDDYFGFPVDLDFARDVTAFYRGISDDAKAGLKYGKARFYDAAKVKPNPRVRYLKPLFVLADAYSASCADFFAAFMQDTKRAEVIGEWTIGAGGFTGGAAVIDAPLKTNALIVPIALGFRLDDRTPVENLGVLPTRWFSPTKSDYRGGFARYGESVFRYIRSRLRKAEVAHE